MKISDDQIIRVAKLSQLLVKPEELSWYRNEIEKILNYVGLLEELTGEVPLETLSKNPGGLREDKVDQTSDFEKILERAPEVVQNMFLVPKVLGQEEN